MNKLAQERSSERRTKTEGQRKPYRYRRIREHRIAIEKLEGVTGGTWGRQNMASDLRENRQPARRTDRQVDMMGMGKRFNTEIEIAREGERHRKRQRHRERNQQRKREKNQLRERERDRQRDVKIGSERGSETASNSSGHASLIKDSATSLISVIAPMKQSQAGIKIQQA